MCRGVSHLQCLCGAVHEASTLLSSLSLPIESEICHCNPCRYTSGSLCPAFLPLNGSPASLSSCTMYNHSGKIHRYFCSTCGSRTFDHNTFTGDWLACSGIVEPDSESNVKNVVRVTSHDYVADTKDGGFALILQNLGGRGPIPLYAEGRDNQAMTASEIQSLQASNKTSTSQPQISKRKDKLLASCHCNSIQFFILPPSSTNDKDTKPIDNPEMSKWLRCNKPKYLAMNCPCRSCRLSTGFSFASTISIEPEKIRRHDDPTVLVFDYTSTSTSYDIPTTSTSTSEFSTSSTAKLTKVFPKLKFDFSDKGFRRSFCSVCGASVFSERLGGLRCVNVALGILRGEGGSLAREWVVFESGVKEREMEGAVDEDLVRALEGWGRGGGGGGMYVMEDLAD